jgi:hypothetical protein
LILDRYHIDHVIKQGSLVPGAVRSRRIRQNARERGYVSSQPDRNRKFKPTNLSRYHWALLVGPKNESKDPQLEEGTKFHAKEFPKSPGPGFEFRFEERAVSLMPIDMILVRIMLAKVEDTGKLAQLLRQVPIGQREEGGWNCVAWVKEALLRIERSEGIAGTSELGWEAVREAALSYCRLKRDERRFDGTGKYDPTQVPTFDMILMEETAT